MSNATHACYRCGAFGHLSADCPNYTTGTVTTDSPAPHEHSPPFTLDLNPNPRMACEDCNWSARGEAGWLACQALVHLSQNPGHRLGYSEPCGITTTITDAQLPASAWRGKEDTV